MPPKTFKCAICGEEVSKRKSFLYKKETGERACKTHEEAQQKKDQFDADRKAAELKKQQQEEHRKRERRAHEFGTSEWEKRHKETRDCCWKCLTPGLKHREWNLRLLVAMEKASQKLGRQVLPMPLGDQGQEDVKAIREAMKDPYNEGKAPTYIGQWILKPERKEEVLRQIRKRFRDIADNPIVPMVQLCVDCGKKLGYKVEDQFEEKKEEYDPDKFKKEMTLGLFIYEGIKTNLQNRAESELNLERENEIRKN